jgi:FkbM family methyltransferase
MQNIDARKKVNYFFKNFGLLYTLKKIYFYLIKIIINFFFDRFKLLRIVFLYKTSYYFYYKKIDDLRLEKNSIVLDFGANIGNFSRYINDKFKSRLFLYEPNPYCCEILRKKFASYSNVKIFNLGVYNVSGFKKFYMTIYDRTGFSISESCSFDKSKKGLDLKNFLRIKTLRIENILSKYNHINLLKIDIEGAEYKIINTVIKNINKIDVVFCEFHKTTPLQKKNYINTINLLKKNKLYNKKIFIWI